MQVTLYRRAATFLGIAAILSLGCHKNPTEPATPKTGALEITVSTSSADTDIDANGYRLSIDGWYTYTISVNDTVTIGPLATGRHLVQLYDLAPNCSVGSADWRFVDVIEDKEASVSFGVTCGALGDQGWDY
jgi:hypothetical protein